MIPTRRTASSTRGNPVPTRLTDTEARKAGRSISFGPPTPEVAQEQPALGELTRLFRALHAAPICYCHWKSNEHLRASMLGQSDLDLLIERGAVQTLSRVLSKTTFKRFVGLPWRSYPGIESYVGFDEETGTLLHLHVHYELILGERHLKGYRIPWEGQLLSSRVLDEVAGVYVANPDLELLLLVLRAALKVRTRDTLLAGFRPCQISRDALRELRWLAARSEPSHLERLAVDLVGHKAAQMLNDIVANPAPPVALLRSFARAVDPTLQEYRHYTALGARLRRWTRELHKVLFERVLSPLGFVVPLRRLLPQGGLVIAFVGVDGSGKSTLVKELWTALSSLMDVVPIYLGTGSGPASLPRLFLERMAAVLRRTTKSARVPTEPPVRGRSRSRLRLAGEFLWVWTVAAERRKRAATARRARDRGMVVLCDRLPQSTAVGNDGPVLSHWLKHPSWACRQLARYELASLQAVERLRPDLLVKLHVPLEVALRRKPDTPLAQLQHKLRVLAEFRPPDSTCVLELDATRPLEQVLLEVKRAVWGTL